MFIPCRRVIELIVTITKPKNAFCSFSEQELEALNSVMGGMDGKGSEAKKTAMRLQQIIKHLESFITDYRPSNDDTR